MNRISSSGVMCRRGIVRLSMRDKNHSQTGNNKCKLKLFKVGNTEHTKRQLQTLNADEQNKKMNKWQQQKVKGYNKIGVKKGDKREVRGVARAKTAMQAKKVKKLHESQQNKAALKGKSLEELKIIGLSKGKSKSKGVSKKVKPVVKVAKKRVVVVKRAKAAMNRNVKQRVKKNQGKKAELGFAKTPTKGRKSAFVKGRNWRPRGKFKHGNKRKKVRLYTNRGVLRKGRNLGRFIMHKRLGSPAKRVKALLKVRSLITKKHGALKPVRAGVKRVKVQRKDLAKVNKVRKLSLYKVKYSNFVDSKRVANTLRKVLNGGLVRPKLKKRVGVKSRKRTKGLGKNLLKLKPWLNKGWRRTPSKYRRRGRKPRKKADKQVTFMWLKGKKMRCITKLGGRKIYRPLRSKMPKGWKTKQAKKGFKRRKRGKVTNMFRGFTRARNALEARVLRRRKFYSRRKRLTDYLVWKLKSSDGLLNSAKRSKVGASAALGSTLMQQGGKAGLSKSGGSIQANSVSAVKRLLNDKVPRKVKRGDRRVQLLSNDYLPSSPGLTSVSGGVSVARGKKRRRYKHRLASSKRNFVAATSYHPKVKLERVLASWRHSALTVKNQASALAKDRVSGFGKRGPLPR